MWEQSSLHTVSACFNIQRESDDGVVHLADFFKIENLSKII
jgi:hypothetical protein